MPTLMNCPHSSEGWCLKCVKELKEENSKFIEKNNELFNQLEVAKSKIKKVSDLAEPYLLKYNITNTLSSEALPKIIENICKDIKNFVEIYIDSLISDLGDLEPNSAGIDYLSGAKRQIIFKIGYSEKGI